MWRMYALYGLLVAPERVYIEATPNIGIKLHEGSEKDLA